MSKITVYKASMPYAMVNIVGNKFASPEKVILAPSATPLVSSGSHRCLLVTFVHIILLPL